MRMVRLIAVSVAATVLLSCGGSGDDLGSSSSGGSTVTSAASNVAAAVVNSGPSGVNAVNTLFVSVTLCVPGSTTNCQTIDNIQVDTGSSGLRILSSVLTLALPTTTDSNGNTYVECAQYVDGYAWGPLAKADLTISGESASSVPVQIIGSSDFTAVPDACSSTGSAEDTVQTFGANGIIGVGFFAQDCGAICANTVDNGFYYSCVTANPTNCNQITLALANQVPNPVTLFATDNNGVIIELPGVSAGGATSVTGALVFGIDTESNNTSGNHTVLTVDSTTGNLTTEVAGQTDTASFFDSGSDGYFFNDSSLPTCTDNADFYCPESTTGFTATVVSAANVSVSIAFSVANADSLGASNESLAAFSNLAGTYGASNTFDWGLPFFYGRNVYTVFENASSSVGTGPYIAF